MLREAVELAERAKNQGVLATNRLRLGEALYAVRQISEAISMLEPAVSWYREAGYDDVLPLALIKLGTALAIVRNAEALRVYSEAVDLATRNGNELYRNMALQRQAGTLTSVDLRAARAAWEQALPETPKHRTTSQYLPAADAFAYSGDFGRAEELIVEAERQISEDHKGIDGDAFFDRAHDSRARLALARGDCGVARKETLLIRAPNAFTGPVLRARALICTGSVSERAMRQAVQELERELPAHADDPLSTARIVTTLAELALLRRDWKAAASYAERGIAAGTEGPVYQIHAILALRAARYALGDRAETERLTKDALDLARRIGLDPPAQFAGRADLLKLWRMVPDRAI